MGLTTRVAPQGARRRNGRGRAATAANPLGRQVPSLPREVIEAALAHVVQNKVEAACRRTDLFERRRRLMDDRAAYLAGRRAGTGT